LASCSHTPSSIIWYQRKLGSKQPHRATHWPRVHGLAASAGVWLRANESEISVREGLLFTLQVLIRVGIHAARELATSWSFGTVLQIVRRYSWRAVRIVDLVVDVELVDQGHDVGRVSNAHGAATAAAKLFARVVRTRTRARLSAGHRVVVRHSRLDAERAVDWQRHTVLNSSVRCWTCSQHTDNQGRGEGDRSDYIVTSPSLREKKIILQRISHLRLHC